jgi:hypothetical protein
MGLDFDLDLKLENLSLDQADKYLKQQALSLLLLAFALKEMLGKVVAIKFVHSKDMDQLGKHLANFQIQGQQLYLPPCPPLPLLSIPLWGKVN